MKIRAITASPTWSAYRLATTHPITLSREHGREVKRTSSSSNQSTTSLKHGIARQKAASGTAKLLRKVGRREKLVKRCASFVKPLLRRFGLHGQNTATKTVKRITDAGRRQVFDLTVDHHHAYVANGTLVSNSDSWRYLAIVAMQDRLPKENTPTRYATDRTFSELVALQTRKRKAQSE